MFSFLHCEIVNEIRGFFSRGREVSMPRLIVSYTKADRWRDLALGTRVVNHVTERL